MRFGILSTANIADAAVAPAIRASEHEVRAVASRDRQRAAAFADRHDVPVVCEDYGALFDADVDAVYNPLPNALHAEWTCRAADAGLDVLCEKPLASDADEAVEVVQHCRNAGVTLMEAFMYRYHPRTERALAVADADLGDVEHVHAAFNFSLPPERTDDVRLDPGLAGGALMDVGCYTVSAARQFLGEPVAAAAVVDDARDAGVDTSIAGTLEFADGATATVEASFETRNHQSYRVEGTDGWLEARDAFNPTSDGVVLRWGADGRTVEERFDPVDQYRLQVEHFADRARSGERPRTDGEEAVANMRAVDALYEAARTGGSVPL